MHLEELRLSTLIAKLLPQTELLLFRMRPARYEFFLELWANHVPVAEFCISHQRSCQPWLGFLFVPLSDACLVDGIF